MVERQGVGLDYITDVVEADINSNDIEAMRQTHQTSPHLLITI